MDYVGVAMKAAELCAQAVWTFRTLRPRLARLSRAEIELLAAIQEDRQVCIEIDDQFCVFHAGSILIDSHSDPAAIARYLEAFERLCQRGLFRLLKDGWFLVTETGFALGQRAREGKPLSGPSFWWWRFQRWLKGT
ncbi:MAG: hypothetical protein H5T71_00065 [Chloroflexi bacterium]|uniref:hypothetical protein n=1 Tax=Thermogutta sp. TaxID=1962930 RepID=UPI0019A342B3|nr:hypothetical protein [Thermogutta sp.]MBC7238483.1 hypothetical protein [Chloroflexota bacterium]MBC7351421.1 hypothetical protein [Thermogutta sp.]